MKVIVKSAFLDAKGLHQKGDVIETKSFDSTLMELVPEKEAKEVKEDKPVKAKKTTKK